MARPLSQDLRHRVVAATEGGMSGRSGADLFGFGITTGFRRRQMVRKGNAQRFPLSLAHRPFKPRLRLPMLKRVDDNCELVSSAHDA
jgi:transposase